MKYRRRWNPWKGEYEEVPEGIDEEGMKCHSIFKELMEKEMARKRAEREASEKDK